MRNGSSRLSHGLGPGGPAMTQRIGPQKSLHAICPHCSTPGTVRTSRQITPVYKQFYIDCRNQLCGHSWLAELSVIHSITPSAMPNPDIRLKMGPTIAQIIRTAAAAEAAQGNPANDDVAARQRG